MNRLRKVPLILALALLGCDAGEPKGDAAGQEMDVQSSDVVSLSIPNLSEEALQGRVRTFKERNGEAWTVDDVEKLTGTIVRGSAPVDESGEVPFDNDRLVSIAKAFLEKNRDVLLLPELDPSMFSGVALEAGGHRLVELSAGTTTSWKPDVPVSVRQQITVNIGLNDSIRNFSGSAVRRPVPGERAADLVLPPSSPVLREQIVGSPLGEFGVVSAADLQSISPLDYYRENTAAGSTWTLAYDFEVSREAPDGSFRYWNFIVHAQSGSLLMTYDDLLSRRP